MRRFRLINLVMTFVGTIITSIVFSQSEQNLITPIYSPKGIFDKVYDQYGKEYTLDDLVVDKKNPDGTLKNLLLCTSGYFNLYFENGSGMEDLANPTHNARRAIICQLFVDISNFINSPLLSSTTKVNIWVRNIQSNLAQQANTTGVLGFASSVYVIPELTTKPAIVDNEMWKTIIGGTDSYTNVTSPLFTGGNSNNNFFHGIVAFNFVNPTITWNATLNGSIGFSEYDLYSVALHEVTHALGFASLIKSNGQSVFQNGNNNQYFSRYDLFLKNHSMTTSLISGQNSCGLYGFTPNTAFIKSLVNPGNCNLATNANTSICSESVFYQGSVTIPVYTPHCFESGSSISHFEDMCYPGGTPYGNDAFFAMCNASPVAVIKRSLKSEERLVLCDLGYNVNSTFGAASNNNYYDYQSSVCSGQNTVGITDGIENGLYTFVGELGSPITINGSASLPSIISNDLNTNSFSCLEDVYDSTAFFSQTFGTSLSQATMTTNVSGLHLLRYVPISSSNVKGNITYLYVFVNEAGCNGGICELLSNGNFESSTCTQWTMPEVLNSQNNSTVFNGDLDCWYVVSGSPDVYKPNCVNSSFNSLNTSSHLGIGKFNLGAGLIEGSESFGTKLSQTLMPNGNYQVTFKAFTKNTSSNVNGQLLLIGSATPIAYQSWNDFSSLPNTVLPLTTVNVSSLNQWNSFTTNFIAPNVQNLNYFAIVNKTPSPQNPSFMVNYTYLEDFSLTPILAPSTISASTNPICSSQQVTLTASGGTFYTWAPDGQITASINVSPTTTTTYTVTGINVIGCSIVGSSTISVQTCTDCIGGTFWNGLTAGTTAGTTTLSIPNNITISGNVTLTNCNVKIMPGVTITVSPNANLTITGSHLYGCESMWQGIKVQAGGKVNIQASTTKTTLIEDATIAIDYAPITASQTTPVLQVNKATFNKNETAINIQGYTIGNVATIFSVKNSLFTCRSIYNAAAGTWATTNSVKDLNGTTDPLAIPYINSSSTFGYPLSSMKAPLSGRSNMGISIKNVGTTTGSGPFIYNELIIGSSVVAEYNLFDNLNYGIDALNSNLKVQNCKFQDPKKIVALTTPTGFGLGINAQSNNQTKYRAQVLNACAFYNMNRAVKIDYYHESMLTGNTIRSQRQIAHSASPLSASIPGRYGIYIRTNDYRNITMTNNTLYNIEKGIYVGTENVPLTSTPTVLIEQNTVSANVSGYSISTNSVFDAIQVINVNSLPYAAAVNVFANNLGGVYRGILLQTWNRSTINVSTNTITMSDQANDPEQYGIAFKNISGGAIKNTISLNYVTGFTGSSAYANTSGIKAESSFSTHLECNNIYNTYYGLHFKGNTYTTSTKRNTMNNNKYGFVLDGASVMLGNQVAPNAPCDNIWSGTTWSPTNTPNGNFKTLVRNLADAQYSKMYVRSTNLGFPSSFNPNGSSSYDYPSLSSMAYAPANLALFVSSGPATSCNSAYIPEDTTLVLEEAAVQMETAVSTMESSSLSEEELAKQKTDVYRSLDANPAVLLESSNLQAFYDSTALSNKGVLLDAEKASNDGNSLLVSQKLNSVAPSDIVEYNYKLFYNLCLKAKDLSFTASDSVELVYLATACPDVDGGVVYQARALYNAIYVCAETFETNCAENTAKSMHVNTENSEEIELIRVYPNPNKGEFKILISDPTLQTLNVKITDVSGQTVYSAVGKTENQELYVSFNCHSGLYCLEVTNPAMNQPYYKKLLILK